MTVHIKVYLFKETYSIFNKDNTVIENEIIEKYGEDINNKIKIVDICFFGFQCKKSIKNRNNNIRNQT